MDVILDTDTLIHAEHHSLALGELLESADHPSIAAITMTELTVGVAFARTDIQRQQRLRFVRTVHETCDVIGYGSRMIAAHAALIVWTKQHGAPHGPHDLIIAATAVAENRTLVTKEQSPAFELPGLAVRRVLPGESAPAG